MLNPDNLAPTSAPARPASDATPEQLRRAFDAQAAVALRLRTSTARERAARIRKLRDALLQHREALHEAFAQDMHKSPAEVEATELLPVMDEIRHALGRVGRWMKPQGVWPTSTSLGTRAAVHYQPRGRVLIIAPWNYPFNLCFGPLVSAVAAGNTVVLKPSEMTPAVAALMGRIVAQVFPPEEVAYFEGGPATSQALLDLPFDHIFFTGSPAVGKIVMAAAARHLASVTLELGGKSPTLIDETADLAMAAETVMWGKFLNNGQTCIAPDYLLVHASVKAPFIEHCLSALQRLYGATAQDRQGNPDLTRVVNARHTDRLAAMLQDATSRGARIVAGGEVAAAERYIAPTLLDNVPEGARVLEEEIFGPLLPICTYTDLDSAIAGINAGPKPLALYVFSRNAQHVERVVQGTSSGGVCVNTAMLHFAHGNLPFGGVNNSGLGNAHGFYGFKAFSHERAVLRGTPLRLVKMFFPPFTAGRTRLIRRVVDSLRLPML